MRVNIWAYAQQNFTADFDTIVDGTNNTQSWNTVFDQIVDQLDLRKGGTVYFPTFQHSGAPQPYRLKDTLRIDASNVPISIEGDGGTLQFITSPTAIGGNTYGIYITSSDARLVSIKNISVHGNDNIDCGIYVDHKVKISMADCKVRSCKKNGIEINSDGWAVTNVASTGNRHNGFVIAGTHGIGIGLNAMSNCIDDSGSANIKDTRGANTYIGCHTSGTAHSQPAYLTTSEVEDSMFIGCYYELDQHRPIIRKENTYWGGQIEDGIDGAGTISHHGYLFNNTEINNPPATPDTPRHEGMLFKNTVNPNNEVWFRAGGNPAGSIFEFEAMADISTNNAQKYKWRFKYRPYILQGNPLNWDNYNYRNFYRFDREFNDQEDLGKNFTPLAFVGINDDLQTPKRISGCIALPKGYFLGKTKPIYVGYSNSTDPLPLYASVLKQNGNRIYNITPDLTDPEHKHAGWVYIEEDGNGGGWHKFGEIEP